MGYIIGNIIGIIFVIFAAILGLMMIFSCTNTYKEIAMEQMKKEEIEKIRKSFPKKIIISIKHEKTTEADSNQ
ncbi:MAG: hypothetical protein K2L78_07035 [Muribaculaceae bacterium]|nr:hypothetical protein [Muribaculaceae bacterium]